MNANSFAEAGAVAKRVLQSFPVHTHGSIIQVCGPITTGGFNSVKQNFVVFADAVRKLRERGNYVFDQTPLEIAVSRLWQDWKNDPANYGYCWPILEEIYQPLFESKIIGRLLFLPGWEYSTGTCWERSQGLSLSISVEPYPIHLYDEILYARGLVHP